LLAACHLETGQRGLAAGQVESIWLAAGQPNRVQVGLAASQFVLFKTFVQYSGQIKS